MNRKILSIWSCEQNLSNNTDWITLATVISAISVVLLHTNGCFWRFSATESYWFSANIIESIFYFAVPVFFMISASTLLDFNKRYSLEIFFKKRITKTVIPYFFWSLIGVLFWHKAFLKAESKVLYVLSGLLRGSLVGIYWFFIPLFSIYLSMPLYAAVPEEKRKGLFTYISIVSFIICIFFPFMVNILGYSFKSSLTVGVGTGYLFFVPTGYLISHYEMKPQIRRAIYILGIAGLLVHIIGTYFTSMEAGKIIRTFKGYCNLPSILYAVAVFVFFKQYGNKLMQIKFIGCFVRFLVKYTFSIYLLHKFIMSLIEKFLPVNVFSLEYRLLIPVPIIAIIVFGTSIARKIPVGRRLLP